MRLQKKKNLKYPFSIIIVIIIIIVDIYNTNKHCYYVND